MLCQICQRGHCYSLRQLRPISNVLKMRKLSSNSTTCIKSEWMEPVGFDSGIKVYNSLAKMKTPLILKNENQLTWYMCGPTVYDSAHIGHASSYMRFDIIRRIMENYFDIDVHLVMGITDIDDKIIAKSNRVNKPFTEISKKYEVEFFQDMEKFNILPPTQTTRVSDHISQIIKYIQKICDNNLTYITPDGSLYFDVVKYGRYGYWTQILDKDAKVETFKKHPSDFALWKGVKPGEPYWSSPWGEGRPGWHIECSTMASGIFGSNFDLHTGGDDLKFPHHENEIAQSQAHYNCHQWVNYWLHTGYLHLQGDINKMSKSLQNVVTISDYLDNYTANQFRTFCLLTKYGHYLEYSEDILKKSSVIYSQIVSCLNMCDAYVKGQIDCQPIDEVELQTSINDARKTIQTALSDDFTTTIVMDTIHNLIKQLNLAFSKQSDSDSGRNPACIASASIFIKSNLSKLGFNLESKGVGSKNGDNVTLNAVMNNMLELRSAVRQYSMNPPDDLFAAPLENTKEEKTRRQKLMSPLLQSCDKVRDDLKSVKITIKDHGKESTWQFEDK